MRLSLHITLAIAALALLFACGSADLASHKIPTDAAPGSSVYVVEFNGL